MSDVRESLPLIQRPLSHVAILTPKSLDFPTSLQAPSYARFDGKIAEQPARTHFIKQRVLAPPAIALCFAFGILSIERGFC